MRFRLQLSFYNTLGTLFCRCESQQLASILRQRKDFCNSFPQEVCWLGRVTTPLTAMAIPRTGAESALHRTMSVPTTHHPVDQGDQREAAGRPA